MTNQDCAWPSGNDKPVCLLRFSHEEFSRKAGIVFENGSDDLDEYFGSFAEDKEIGPMEFLYYLNAPVPGVAVYVDSTIETSRALMTIKKKFNLIDTDISWIREIED